MREEEGEAMADQANKKNKICSVEGCGGKVLAKSLCCKHYYQHKRHGCITNASRKKRTHCIVENCDRPHYSRGYCSRHYQQLLKKGSPLKESSRRVPKIYCYVPGCRHTVFSRGYCRLHYIKMRSLEMLAEAHPEWVVLGDTLSQKASDKEASFEESVCYDDQLKEAFEFVNEQ